MKKFNVLVLLAFFITFFPNVKSEEYVTVKTNNGYSTKFQITGTHTESSSTTSCRNSSSGSNDDSRVGGDNRGSSGGGSSGGSGIRSNCTTTNTDTTVNKNSSWQTLNGGASHTFSLPDIGIDAGDTYTVKYDVIDGGSGHCGSEYMQREVGSTTNYYTMQNRVSNADCGTGRR